MTKESAIQYNILIFPVRVEDKNLKPTILTAICKAGFFAWSEKLVISPDSCVDI